MRLVARSYRTRSMLAAVIAVALAVLVGCKPTAPTNVVITPTAPEIEPALPPFFQEIEDSGIDFTYRNGEESGHMAILESLGSKLKKKEKKDRTGKPEAAEEEKTEEKKEAKAGA